MPPLALAVGAALAFADFLTGTYNLPAAAATAVQEQGLLTYNCLLYTSDAADE